MELLSRTHYSSASSSTTATRLWIIGGMLLLAASWTPGGYCLQGSPSWICLGLKSPFIEFKAADEVLSNVSISLNSTDKDLDEHGMPISNSGPFIYPDEMAHLSFSTSTTSKPKRKNNRLRQKEYSIPQHQQHNNGFDATTENPVVADMNSKKEVTIIEIHNEDEYTDEKSESERKYIIPLALKNPTPEPRKSQLFQDSSTNIDDLKRHILMLQNLTKNDQSFQSKFVVFPSLQRNQSSPTTTTVAPTQPTTTTRRPLFMSRISSMRDSFADDPVLSNGDFHRLEKITIVPQVFLQNDQMLMNDDSFETHRTDDRVKPPIKSRETRRKNYRNRQSADDTLKKQPQRRPTITATTRKTTTTTTTTSTTPATTTSTTTTTVVPPRKSPSRRRNNNNNKQNREERQRLRMASRKGGVKSKIASEDVQTYAQDGQKIVNQTPADRAPQLKPDRTSTTIPNYPHANANTGAIVGAWENITQFTRSSTFADGHSSSDDSKSTIENNKTLSRSARSSQHNVNQAIVRNASSMASKDMLFPSALMSNQTPLNSYKEHIDLNPDLCYGVAGFSNGQKKLCVQNTHVMPAISRGARSAIQECKHQFKNRRWNCSTVDDPTVFGPVSGIGSPEMAFVHALAAAGAASFIARACRDGQLASCGCSRSARPNHLHDDWTWGGCGDDLEYGYKFSQNFIDIREKEKKRGARGLVTVPNLKYDPLLGLPVDTNVTDETQSPTSDSADEGAASGPIKAEDLLDLQEKITKEILSSKLDENDMQDLQAKINRELLKSKVFNLDHQQQPNQGRRHRIKPTASAKARSLMNLHNNEAGRRAVIKKSRITCKCHGVSGSCSLITCWQQLTSMREIGDFLREKYDEATQVRMNKRGRLQVKDQRYKKPTALDLVYLEESPDWCRSNRQLQWPGTTNRVCNKTSTGLDGCAILCCGRGYNTKKIVVKERCNCKFHWCCHVKCETCVKVIEEYSCK